MQPCRDWVGRAITKIHQDFQRSADTHLFKVEMGRGSHIDFYFKDESTHPTGNLKHRLARSLFLHALCNGYISERTPIIEASSGNSAISEAYFAKLLGLEFIAVIPESTSREKIEQIEFYGGRCHFVQHASEVYDAATTLARELRGHYMDQFTYAEQATDWRGNNNIAESIFEQMQREPHPEPSWVVVGAGTGGTSATIGRYIRYQCKRTKLCVVDPENSVFEEYFRTGNPHLSRPCGSRIEGIGRPRVEPSFVPTVIDRMLTVPDAVSVAAMQLLERWVGKRFGPSSGTNFSGMITLAQEMRSRNESGSIVGLACDSGDRYNKTYYDPTWVRQHFGDAVDGAHVALRSALENTSAG
jgi:cysteine synthase A